MVELRTWTDGETIGQPRLDARTYGRRDGRRGRHSYGQNDRKAADPDREQTERHWTDSSSVRVGVHELRSSWYLEQFYASPFQAMLSNEFEVPQSPKSPQSVGTAFVRFRRDTSLLVDMTVSSIVVIE